MGFFDATYSLVYCWKNQFLDSEYWILFGIETIVVLLVCMVSAYGIGALLCHFFPQINQVYLYSNDDNSTNNILPQNHKD